MTLQELLPVAIPAVVSIIAAIIAGRSARRAGASDREAQRLRDLEARLSVKKYETYEPFLKALGDMLTPGRNKVTNKAMLDSMADFMNLVVAYGSDDVIRAYARFRAASSSEPPATVTVRLIADLVVAMRRDLGGATTLTGLEVLGMRINDLYSSQENVHALSAPFEEVCQRAGWVPPWRDVEGEPET